MPSRSKSRVLTNRDEIRQWAEARNARPTCVPGTGDNQDVGIIRLDFPGYSGEGSLQEVDWDEWFSKFEQSGLALLVQDETASGQQSNFNNLVSRETVESAASGRSSSGRARGSGRRSQARRTTSRRGSRSRSTSQSRGRPSRSSQSLPHSF